MEINEDKEKNEYKQRDVKNWVQRKSISGNSGKWHHLASLLEKGKNEGILRLLEDILLCVYIHLKSYYAVLLWLGSS